MNNIKMKGVCKRILFKNYPFSISVFEDENGKEFTLKANFTPKVDSPYNIIAVKDDKSKYEDTYKCVTISYDIDLSKVGKRELITFISTLTSKRNAENIVNTLDNPVEVLENRDVDELTKVKGVGVATAHRIFDSYEENKDDSADVLMLSEYGFSDNLVRALLKHYGSGQAVVSVIESNVYKLTEVKGIGFKKADMIFLLNLKGDPSDPKRSEAYTEYLFKTKYQEGYTWISPSEFVNSFKEDMPACDVKEAILALNDNPNYEMRVDRDNNKRLSLKYVSDKERSVAANLYRIFNAKSHIVNNNLDSVIAKLEESQGWEYDSSQRNAIDSIEANNVILIQGLAGTGKSTIVNAYVKAAQQNNYTIKQCALSGKAANNLANITGINSSTIHSLLEVDFMTGGFKYKKDNQLPVDIVIVDEISMVSLDIFEALIQAIPKGAKLIMLGDNGQLESIGAGIMQPIQSIGSVKSVSLSNIHRQAQKSAIITHSLAFRKGLIPKGMSLSPMSSTVYGENKDLQYIILKDGDTKEERQEISNQTLFGVAKVLKSMLKDNKIEDIQIVTQTIAKGMGAANDLNKIAQNTYNTEYNKSRVWKRKVDNFEFEFREGDRVINVANSYNVLDSSGRQASIYNGTMGNIVEIKPNEYIRVDFDNIGEIDMLPKDVQNLLLGYAITTHKAQGSTIKNLIVVLAHHYMLNSQGMIYTSVTRGGGKCVVVTTPKAIKRSVTTDSSVTKNSSLKLFMEDIYERIGENNNASTKNVQRS